MHTLELQEAVEVLELQEGAEHQTLVIAGLAQDFETFIHREKKTGRVAGEAELSIVESQMDWTPWYRQACSSLLVHHSHLRFSFQRLVLLEL